MKQPAHGPLPLLLTIALFLLCLNVVLWQTKAAPVTAVQAPPGPVLYPPATRAPCPPTFAGVHVTPTNGVWVMENEDPYRDHWTMAETMRHYRP